MSFVFFSFLHEYNVQFHTKKKFGEIEIQRLLLVHGGIYGSLRQRLLTVKRKSTSHKNIQIRTNDRWPNDQSFSRVFPRPPLSERFTRYLTRHYNSSPGQLFATGPLLVLILYNRVFTEPLALERGSEEYKRPSAELISPPYTHVQNSYSQEGSVVNAF